MSDFVEQCRREWRRLGVADPLAEEMATDLAADLGEAEAEGVPAEEFLGDSAFDPRSFAASWAAERGIIPERRARGVRRRPTALVVFTAFASLVLVVAALLLLTGEPKLSLVTSGPITAHLAIPPAGPGAPAVFTHKVIVRTSAAAPVEWILLFFSIVALAFAAWLWSRWGRSRLHGAPAR
jgi:hypothetical protein